MIESILSRLQRFMGQVDKEVQREMQEAELDMFKEDRLERVKARQREFWTRKMVKEVMDDVLELVIMYRPAQEAKEVLDWMQWSNVG